MEVLAKICFEMEGLVSLKCIPDGICVLPAFSFIFHIQKAKAVLSTCSFSLLLKKKKKYIYKKEDYES